MMGHPPPLEASSFHLLAEALENVLITPESPCQICGHICEQMRKVTGAEILALVGGSDPTELKVLAVQPPAWKSKLEAPAARPLLEHATSLETVTYLVGGDENGDITPLPLQATNALILPLMNGTQRIGAVVALSLQAAATPESLTQTLQPLSKVLGLLLRNAMLQVEPTFSKRDLAAPENRSRAIFDAVNDAIMVHEVGTGAILDVNRRMCEMFGLTYEEALWMDMGSLSVGLAPCTQDEAWEWMRKTSEEGPQTFEWVAKHKTGRLFWVEINMRLADIGGQQRLLSTARDITERKRTDAEQASRLKRSEAQNAIFLALAGVGLNYETALELIAHHLAVQVGDLCVLDILDETEGVLHPVAVDQPYIDGRPLIPDCRSLSPFPLGTPGAGQVARCAEAHQVADPSGERIKPLIRSEFHPYLDYYGVHALLIVPMRSQGKVIGTITLARCGTTRNYSAEDLAMLQNLADRSALTLVNARLYSENLQQAEQLREANAVLEQRVAERTAELEKAMEALHRLAVEDTLTGIANRRRFNDVMEEEIRRARRANTPLSLLMGDVDFFKRYNDHYGHQGGDDCLRMVGAVLRDTFKRAGDLPARYGGEEFAVVLPGVDGEQAKRAGELLRRAIADRAMPHKGSDVAPYVTMSIGVATAATVTDEIDSDWFVAKADEALYQSKAAGRDRVTSA